VGYKPQLRFMPGAALGRLGRAAGIA
jgi:hypothetical protein